MKTFSMTFDRFCKFEWALCCYVRKLTDMGVPTSGILVTFFVDEDGLENFDLSVQDKYKHLFENTEKGEEENGEGTH